MSLASRPRVVLRQGTIIGKQMVGTNDQSRTPQTLDYFLGVPYALSTAGEHRWKQAVLVGASTGEFDAGRLGKRCPAGEEDMVDMGEDCLNLNIYRPSSRPKDKKLPVLVYFHGGSFNFGAGHYRRIDSMVAWSDRPFIGISFNYRLGAFGFLSSKLAKKEGALNLGLRDQSLLLQWVQDNISAFDGNPNDVTIMGSSAGAHSVGHHVLVNSPDKPLFHKAIIESGGATARACLPYDNEMHETQFNDFLGNLGLLQTPPKKVFDVLRTIPTSKIKDASEKVFIQYTETLRWPFQPVIDGEGGMIPIAPITKWKSGTWQPIPILTGFNTNEGAVFVDPAVATDKKFTSFFSLLLPKLSASDIEALGKTYPDPLTDEKSTFKELRTSDDIGPQYTRLEQAYGHFAYVNPVRQTVHYASKSAPVWLYRFEVNSRYEGGADHGDHDDFVTYNEDVRAESPSIREISGKMHAYWTSFVTTGDPNADGGVWEERATWPRFTMGADGKYGRAAIFGSGNSEIAGGKEKGMAVKIEEDTWRRKECQYWDERTELFES
ncbi:alpha/beta-Hydrolase [Glarea lozoyensis ATCC 20868]|uniref:Alpha/beta-Hydrolase n=1 Tax=Glarea lozoyensis (strain ATCC 20868 / MF5171) TaxID=1116229 RepID=S3CWZ5_GLAL2|nr:alpha/beta-Hydrolase [Glarea lozoyensis ATCC 20868]EPE29464.1 alpha/beta-Hydrolase [Glarea lozoyensis ATCC 20868]